MSENTDYVPADQGAGSKLDKARELGCPCWTMRSSSSCSAAGPCPSRPRKGVSFEPMAGCADRRALYDPTVTASLTKEVRKLSMAKKTQQAEVLWDEVAARPDDLPVPDAHKRLLDARLAAHLEAPDSAITLDEFRRCLARQL